MVYAAVATALFVIPASYAVALIVSAAFTATVTGEAAALLALGVVPSVV